jgi:hypothetical protein
MLSCCPVLAPSVTPVRRDDSPWRVLLSRTLTCWTARRLGLCGRLALICPHAFCECELQTAAKQKYFQYQNACPGNSFVRTGVYFTCGSEIFHRRGLAESAAFLAPERSDQTPDQTAGGQREVQEEPYPAIRYSRNHGPIYRPRAGVN